MVWTNLKEKLKKEEDRIKILSLIFLLTLLAFGCGYLVSRYQNQEPLELIEEFQRINH